MDHKQKTPDNTVSSSGKRCTRTDHDPQFEAAPHDVTIAISDQHRTISVGLFSEQLVDLRNSYQQLQEMDRFNDLYDAYDFLRSSSPANLRSSIELVYNILCSNSISTCESYYRDMLAISKGDADVATEYQGDPRNPHDADGAKMICKTMRLYNFCLNDIHKATEPIQIFEAFCEEYLQKKIILGHQANWKKQIFTVTYLPRKDSGKEMISPWQLTVREMYHNNNLHDPLPVAGKRTDKVISIRLSDKQMQKLLA